MSKEPLHDFFESALKKPLLQLEKKRQQIIKKCAILSGIVAIVIIIIGLKLSKTPLNTLSPEEVLGTLLILGITIVGGFFIFIKPNLNTLS